MGLRQRFRQEFCTLEFYDILVMSVALMTLFAAYNTVQNYVTSLLPGHLGTESLAVLYGTVALSVFIAPVIVEKWGEKWTMIAGAVGYVAYIASLIHIVRGVVLAAAVVIGFGAAILWVAQGSFLTRCSSNDTRGRNSGIFWGIFQFSNVFGNMAAFFVFKYLSTTALFVIFTSLAVTGTAMLLFIRWPIAAKPTSTITTTEEEEEEDKEEQTSKHRLDKQQGQEHINSSSCYTEHSPLIPENGDIQPQKVVNERKKGAMSASLAIVRAVVVNQLGDWDVLLLLPMFFWTGLELAFWTGEFPLVLDEKVIGLVLMFTGIAEMIGGIVVGWLSDKFLGRSITVLLGSLLYALALLLSVFLKHGRFFHPQLLSASSASSSSSSSGEESDDEERLPLIAIVAAVCFGLGDCIFNTQTYAMLGELSSLKSPLSSSSCSSSSSSPTSKEDSAYAVGSFTIFQLLQNLGGALGFVLPLVLPFHGQHSTPTHHHHHHSHLFLLLRRESSQVGDEEDDEEKGGSMGQIWIQSGVLGLAALCYLVARLRYRRALKQRQHHHPSLPPPPPQPQKPLLQIN